MEEAVIGTVTSLSSLFSPEEARKASKRVQDTISDSQTQLDQLQHFVADNTNLLKLVHKLPQELHHHIMVPFGKAAFFPGRLIHTNEFLVLLGEGYYAERTSKQTIDILKRRGKVLESQVESLKAVTQDLKAEASFFDATATEAAEGFVEIREEIEETSAELVSEAGLAKPDTPNFSDTDSMKADVEDEEFDRIMSMMNEFEREEELAEESVNEGDEDEDNVHMMSGVQELEEKELVVESVSECDEDKHSKADFEHCRRQNSLDHKQSSSEEHRLRNPTKLLKDDHKISKEFPSTLTVQQDFSNQFESLKAQSVLSEDKTPSDQSFTLAKSSSAEKTLVVPEVKENVRAEPQSRKEAFTGSIVEHTHNLGTNLREQTTVSKSSTPQMSKPVSRFKMQRR